MEPSDIIRLDAQALDDLVPFALVVKNDGAIVHAGRSIKKILAKPTLESVNFFDTFSIAAPRILKDIRDLSKACNIRVSLSAHRVGATKPFTLRATIARCHKDSSTFFVLTTLGVKLPEIVEELELFDRDFAHADSSVDLLYFLSTQGQLLKDAHELAERLRAAKDRAENLAQTDALTNLPNRRGLTDYTTNLMHKPTVKNSNWYLLHVDLDRFKQVNDTHGHAAGDTVLCNVATLLKDIAGPEDIVARVGGDEFIWIAKSYKSNAQIASSASALIKLISVPHRIGKQLIQIGSSIGITRIDPQAGKSLDSLLLEADLALYAAKNSGRGQTQFFSDGMMQREATIQELIRDIEPALQRKEFVPFFQPQIDDRDGSVCGAEVLGRWLHPKHGIINPVDFLFVAGRANLIEKIDRTIYCAALDQFARWKQEGIAPGHISLNITADMLELPDFAEWIMRQLDSRGIAPNEIMFELLETILMDGNTSPACSAANTLSKLGFPLAIDDFGTGRASLNSLISIPVQCLKIDRAFVNNLHKEPKRRLLAKAIIDVAENFELDLIAEGVERIEEVEALKDMGCTRFQGYYFCKPVVGAEFSEMLKDNKWQEIIQVPALPGTSRRTG